MCIKHSCGQIFNKFVVTFPGISGTGPVISNPNYSILKQDYTYDTLTGDGWLTYFSLHSAGVLVMP
jgi:hypothetical protein